MKLYYSPGACSLSPHIIIREIGLDVELIKVDLKSHKTAAGEDFYTINPKGYVPFLVLDNGDKLSEGIAITLYLASQNPKANITPAPGSVEFFHMIEWQVFISTELHKNFGPLFSDMGDKAKEIATKKLEQKFEYVSKQLGAKKYLMGEQFTLPDAYLFVILSWAYKMNLQISALNNLKDFHARVGARPAVEQALKAEK